MDRKETERTDLLAVEGFLDLSLQGTIFIQSYSLKLRKILFLQFKKKKFFKFVLIENIFLTTHIK